MALIYETKHFFLESAEKPEIDREDWWHVKINPKEPIEDRTHLSPKQAIELMRLTVIAGKAMKTGLWERGIDIKRINYQDNGNRRPELHIHLYGRSVDAKIQKFGDPIIPGHREEYQALNEDDIVAIRKECEYLFTLPEFSDTIWWL